MNRQHLPKKTRKNLAIIPARGGSKRLPGKNKRLLNGKPLISYTIEAALESQCFSDIIFTSDDASLLDIAASYDSVTLDQRDPTLASDTSKVIDTVKELISRPEIIKKDYQTVTLLLPTCPFRRASDIRNGFKLLDTETDAVISATEFDFPITMSFKLLEDNTIEYLFNPSPLVTGNTRSQDHPQVLRPNGGFYIANFEFLRFHPNFFSGKTKAYVMPREYSLDIDTLQDFLLGEILLKEQIISLKERD